MNTRGTFVIALGDRYATGLSSAQIPSSRETGQRPVPQRSAPRRAFTLVEMMVSLVVIIIVLAIVTNVFAIATQTTQTAQAITDVQTQLDGIVRELEADLRGVKTDRSVLLIYGRTQAAALTEADRQANKYYRFFTGDPEVPVDTFDPTRDPLPATPTAGSYAAQFSNARADLMMFFTERPTQTAVPVETGGPANVNAFQRSLAFGAKGSPVQVVYGHAAIATVRPEISGGEVTGYELDQVRHIEQIRVNQGNQDRNLRSILPLSEWVVARRALIVEPILPPDSASAQNIALTRRVPSASFQGGNNADPLASVLVQARPANAFSVAGGPSSERAPDSIPFDMTTFLRILDPNPAYDAGSLRTADNSNADVSSYFGNRTPEPATVRRSRVAQASPYRWRTQGATFSPNVVGGAPWQKFSNVNGFVDVDPVLDAFFPPDGVNADGIGPEERSFRHFATAIKEPPAALRGNLNMQRLRACAWFQVEFLMPEDPRNAWDHPDGQARSGMPRWIAVPDGDYYVFVPDSRDNRTQLETQLPTPGQTNRWRAAPPNSRLQQFGVITPLPNGKDEELRDRRVRTWPYAVRVTMRMFDSKGVLKDPITRTFEHWFD